ncbi:MAG: 4-hydroxy-3-methylbut-2-enyl diphosphate reductase [Planctomycetota bacterium]
MTIEVASPYGFCFGVRRAVEVAEEAARTHGNVTTLGPIIHNPQEVGRLAAEGIRPVESAEGVVGSVVVIRSHGATREEMEKLEGLGVRIIDATCPLVERVQEHAARLAREGYQVLLLGEARHPEVKAILSHAPGAALVQSPGEVEGMELGQRVGIVSQTTQSPEALSRLVYEVARKGVREMVVYNTICSATADRQAAAAELAGRVECMFVLGGKNSANSRRLAEICRRRNGRTFHVETHRELEREMYAGAGRIGVAAGTSTPDWIVSEFVRELGRLCASRTQTKGDT